MKKLASLYVSRGEQSRSTQPVSREDLKAALDAFYADIPVNAQITRVDISYTNKEGAQEFDETPYGSFSYTEYNRPEPGEEGSLI